MSFVYSILHSCFLSQIGAFFGAFLAPIIVVMIFNVVIFIRVIIVMIRHTRDSAARQHKSVSKQTIVRLMISISGVMFLFGLTWMFAILTFSVNGLRETFQTLFVVFNSFQGLFMFIFICILNKDVLESWREVISCGTYKSKLLHPSPAKPVAVGKHKPMNAAYTSSSSGAGKFISVASKYTYDSTTIASQPDFRTVETLKPDSVTTESATPKPSNVNPATTDEGSDVGKVMSTATTCHHEVDIRVDIHIRTYNNESECTEGTTEQV